jgi:hypothetical protein
MITINSDQDRLDVARYIYEMVNEFRNMAARANLHSSIYFLALAAEQAESDLRDNHVFRSKTKE